jgi:hypothetical protein
MTIYRDNYPNNIEAPQKLYIQYSHDIDWDYSTNQYPDGTEDDWHWESNYIPISHAINGLTVERHEWMRIRIGTRADWTYPIRISANVTNIGSVSEQVIIEEENYTSFKIILTFEDGSTVESDPIVIRNGQDGLGVDLCEVRADGYLYITYSDGTIQNAGRARGLDANIPPAQNDDYLLSQSAGTLVWVTPLQALNNAALVTSPIEYDFLTGTFSHNNDDGNRHIPVGGSNGYVLSTDGSGNYTWINPVSPIISHASLVDLDWTTSAHTGTADTFSGFNGSGNATEYSISDYMNNYITQSGIDWDTYSPDRAEFIVSNVNSPLGSTSVHGLFIPHSTGASNTYGTVIAGRLNTDPDPDEPTLWFRNLENSVWTSWIEILHTNNIDDYLSTYLSTYSHNSLDDVDLATTGITYGHIDDQSQSIYGAKNFVNGIDIATSGTSLTFIVTGTSNNDKLPTQGYVDDITYQLEVALAQLDTDIVDSVSVAKFPCPEDMTMQSMFIKMTIAPVDSSAVWDVNVEGSSIMTDLIEIEDGEYSSLDATTQPSFSDPDIDRDEDIVIDCDQKGATTAGQNPVLVITYKKR